MTVIPERLPLQLFASVLALAGACSTANVTAWAEDDHVRGQSTAAVTLIEYGDNQCPPCSNSARDVERLLEEYPRDVRFIYRHFPTRRHRNAVAAAKAAEAAERQGQFWQMHASLFANQQDWYGVARPEQNFVRYARQLRLDDQRFREALAAPELDRRIRSSHESGRDVSVRGAPAFFLNGKRLIPPPLTYDALRRDVARALTQ